MTTASNSTMDMSLPVLFLDVDNTLYSKSLRIHDLMSKKIDEYFVSLNLPESEAIRLHSLYYKEYGLALRGLVKHHQIDAIDYDKRVDQTLPLEQILKPDPKLRKLLTSLDRTKVRLWVITNAYKVHATRVLTILGIIDLFEGLVYCDYADPDFSCKPEKRFFDKAMAQAGVKDPSKCYIVDDSRLNVVGAKELGWTSVHFVPDESSDAGTYQIKDLEELRTLFPQFFKA